jgi:hypothetical protein
LFLLKIPGAVVSQGNTRYEKTKKRKGEAFISYRPVIVKLDGKVDSHDAPVP